MFGPELTHWTIRLALIGFVAGLALAIRPGIDRQFRWFRACWTVGCAFFLLHVVCAFTYFYHWSHVYAVEQTAIKTERLIGVAFGNGIWFSYLFTVIWIADVAWAWLAAESYRQRSAAWVIGVCGYLSFIAFQGSVVFEAGIVRPLAALATLALLVSLVWVRWPQSLIARNDRLSS